MRCFINVCLTSYTACFGEIVSEKVDRKSSVLSRLCHIIPILPTKAQSKALPL
jgi:hypothetical protein